MADPSRDDRIDAAIAAYLAACDAGSPPERAAFLAAHPDLAAELAEFLGNGEILRVAGQLRERMQLVVTQVFRLCRDRIDTSYHEHTAIADAAIGGDGARASELIVRHLELGKQLILSPRG